MHLLVSGNWCLICVHCTETSVSLPIVEVPIEITVPLQDKSVPEHATVTLECELSKPDVKVTWMLNGAELTLGPKYETIDEGTIHKLVIHDVSPEHVADYTVKVAVKVGELMSTAHLSVEGMTLPFFFACPCHFTIKALYTCLVTSVLQIYLVSL